MRSGRPKWVEEGIPALKMKDHLDERTKQMTKPAAAQGSMQ